jgi:allantoicase
MSEILESKSLKKNINRIVKALEAKGFTNIRLQMFSDGYFSEYTRVYADLRPDLSVVMYAGGEGDNIAFGTHVFHGAGDFPSVCHAEIRAGKPEKILEKILERY